jgi:hypothetical protein
VLRKEINLAKQLASEMAKAEETATRGAEDVREIGAVAMNVVGRMQDHLVVATVDVQLLAGPSWRPWTGTVMERWTPTKLTRPSWCCVGWIATKTVVLRLTNWA